MSSAADKVIFVFSEEQAVRLTGISRRQLAGWATEEFFVTELLEISRYLNRLYSFRDLVSLKVLAQLRNDSKVPVRRLRDRSAAP
jgi:DNA-binding transcriptional MerR regulator